MREFLKHLPIAEDVIRRNPLFYNRFHRLLEKAAGLGESERHKAQSALLERAVSWADAVPGYRYARQSGDPRSDRPRSGDSGGPRASNDFPILTKEVLQAELSKFRSGGILAGFPASTGGSSGRPLRLVRSPASVAVEQATIDWLAAKADVDLTRCRVAVLRGDSIKDPNDQEAPFWRYFGRRRLVLSSSHLNPATFPLFEAELKAFRPDLLLAYPSSLEQLTNLAAERGSTLRVQLAITSSETLRPGLRARVRAAFGAVLLDHYGMAERVSAAYSLEDGVYWFIFPYGATELIAESAGQFRIVGSGLWNRAQPLIRYDTGDIALAPPDADPARLGRIALGVEPFQGIGGRASDVLHLANGARVYALAQISRGVTGLTTVQFVQQADDLIQIIVVPGNRYSSETIEMIRRNFYRKVPKSVRVAFEVRDTPFRLANGKAPVFVSHIAPS